MASEPWPTMTHNDPQWPTNSEWHKFLLLHVQSRSQGFLPPKELANNYSNSPVGHPTSIFLSPLIYMAEALCQARTVEKAGIFFFYTAPAVKSHSNSSAMSGWVYGGPNFIHCKSVGRFDFTHGEGKPWRPWATAFASTPTFTVLASFQEK